MSESLLEMFRHNAWANRRLFDACDGLSDEQLDATVVGTFGSLRKTLIHIVGAQERFVAALSGNGSVTAIREGDPYQGFDELRTAAWSSSETLIELAAKDRSGETVTTTWRGESYTLPVWLLLVQAISHAAEHRSQAAAILTQQGIEPPGMDGWAYHEDVFGGDWSQLWSS